MSTSSRDVLWRFNFSILQDAVFRNAFPKASSLFLLISLYSNSRCFSGQTIVGDEGGFETPDKAWAMGVNWNVSHWLAEDEDEFESPRHGTRLVKCKHSKRHEEEHNHDAIASGVLVAPRCTPKVRLLRLEEVSPKPSTTTAVWLSLTPLYWSMVNSSMVLDPIAWLRALIDSILIFFHSIYKARDWIAKFSNVSLLNSLSSLTVNFFFVPRRFLEPWEEEDEEGNSLRQYYRAHLHLAVVDNIRS